MGEWMEVRGKCATAALLLLLRLDLDRITTPNALFSCYQS